ncbi:MAG: hypothetical protein HY927_08230 [Elusimicrobia bacterium]|nr:hypothetical protein [Elusimicrobiota bacterium]
MNRLTAFLAAAALCGAWDRAAAQVPGGALASVQGSFESHQAGMPYLDAAAEPLAGLVCASGADVCAGLRRTLAKARQVQEGCAPPCDGGSEVELYRAKVEIVCDELGFASRAGGCGAALKNYFPGGVPRKRTAGPEGSPGGREFDAQAVAKLLLDPRLDPKLRADLGDKAFALAEALGRLRWVDAGGGAAVTAGPRDESLRKAKPGGAGVPPGGKPDPAAPKVPAAPIPVGQVERRLTANLNAQIAKFPTGADVLKRAEPVPTLRFERLDEETLAAYANNRGALYFNSVRVAAIVKRLDPSAAKLELDDPKALRGYLAQHPDLLERLPAQMDVLYVHELTHRAQHKASGDGLIGDTIDGWRRILNGGKYPLESEWEAFGNQNRYFGERAKKEPGILDYRDSPELGLFEYQEYVRDLQAYRRGIASNYQDDCGTIDQLKYFGSHKPYYDRVLAREAKEWPKVSYDGSMNLARHWAGFAFPAQALDHLEAAFNTASKNGFLPASKPELAALFGEVVKKIEERFRDAKPGSPGPNFGPSQKETLSKLSAGLGVPLPPRLAAAVGRKKT